QISLDGTEKTHDLIRGKGTFKKALEGLDNCYKYKICTTVMFTLSKLNTNEIEEVIQQCIEHNVKRFSMGRLVPTGNGADLDNQVLTSEELKKFFKKLKKIIKKYRNSIYFAIHDPLWMSYLGIKNTHGCSAGISGICILENGDIMPCRRLNLVIGNIRDNSITEIWNNSSMIHFRYRDNYEGKCKTCKRLRNCGGYRAIARAINNSEYATDPQCFYK
ncbi:MAG: SPASM domain-containing protein, partial [Candidatus Odinarchaeota archaeon]